MKNDQDSKDENQPSPADRAGVLAAPDAGDGVAGLVGRELDAAVAEKVMGMFPCDGWKVDSGLMGISKHCDHLNCFPSKYRAIDRPRPYSTQIAAAMEVRDHIRNTWSFSKRREFTIELIMVVSLRTAGDLGVRLADSAVLMNFTAEDICRAALAVEATHLSEKQR